MHYFATEGVILRRQPYREHGVLCQCITRDKGLISIIAAGVNRENSQSKGLFEPFNRLDLCLYSSRESTLSNVKESGLIESYLHNLPYNKVIIINAAGELLLQLDFSSYDNSLFYDLFVSYCTFIQDTDYHPILVFYRFLLRLFVFLGVPLEVCCSTCKDPFIQNYNSMKHGFLCPRCTLGLKERAVLISNEALTILRNINDLKKTSGITINKVVAVEMLNVFLVHMQNCFAKRFAVRSLNSYKW